MLKNAIHRTLERFGYRLIHWPPPATYFVETSDEDRAIIERCLPFTMVPRSVLWSTLAAVRHVEQAGIPGAIVECGVWRGGNMMAAALANTDRDLWLFDTFAGMPLPEEVDRKTSGTAAIDKWQETNKGDVTDWCYAPLEEVRANVLSTGYPENRLHFVKGKVEDTLKDPANLPERIAVFRLDTDWYASTKFALEVLYPRLSNGGILILDDYGSWQGARQAADEYFSTNRPFLIPQGGAARIAIKHHTSSSEQVERDGHRIDGPDALGGRRSAP